MEEQRIEDIIALLDSCSTQGMNRFKLNVTEGQGITTQYHHGCCDVGSPFAKGQAYDVMEPEDE